MLLQTLSLFSGQKIFHIIAGIHFAELFIHRLTAHVVLAHVKWIIHSTRLARLEWIIKPTRNRTAGLRQGWTVKWVFRLEGGREGLSTDRHNWWKSAVHNTFILNTINGVNPYKNYELISAPFINKISIISNKGRTKIDYTSNYPINHSK